MITLYNNDEDETTVKGKVNPFTPDMKMHIILSLFSTFLMELVRRICLNVKTSYRR